MRTMLIKNFNITNSYYTQANKKKNIQTNPICNSPIKNDAFIKASPNFTANTSHGSFLKNLKGIRDPYSGVVILTSKELTRICEDLEKQKNARGKIRYLKQYESSMLPVEHKIFVDFQRQIKKDKLATFSKLLQKQKPIALKALINEQEEVLNNIEHATKNISPAKQNKIMNCVTDARIKILEPQDSPNRFKRKTFINNIIKHQQLEILDKVENKILTLPKEEKLEALDKYFTARLQLETYAPDTNINGISASKRIEKLQKQYIPETLNDIDEYEPIIKIANKLPNSKTSANAFIIKYADRSEKEIGERLVNQSVRTIEHLEAASFGGENEAENFILTTKSRNEDRGNMPIPEYLEIYENIPKYAQWYMDDIINASHKGKLQNHEWYPYVVKEKFKKESGIELDISKYKIPPEKAFKTLPPRLKDRYPQYAEFIPEKNEPLNLNI